MSACVHLFPDKLIDSFNLMFSLRQEHTLQKIFLENSKLEKEEFCKAICLLEDHCAFSSTDQDSCLTVLSKKKNPLLLISRLRVDESHSKLASRS
jgi:hypothetical protein